jgi:hypothetical protein
MSSHRCRTVSETGARADELVHEDTRVGDAERRVHQLWHHALARVSDLHAGAHSRSRRASERHGVRVAGGGLPRHVAVDARAGAAVPLARERTGRVHHQLLA